MTSDEVKALVDREIRQGWDEADMRANPHGVRLSRCLLVRPERRSFRNPSTNQLQDMWLVLEEDPENHKGYAIVFDESRGKFGLAVQDKESAAFIGYYGSFRDTLEGM